MELQGGIIIIELFFAASESAAVLERKIEFLFGRFEQTEAHWCVGSFEPSAEAGV